MHQTQYNYIIINDLSLRINGEYKKDMAEKGSNTYSVLVLIKQKTNITAVEIAESIGLLYQTANKMINKKSFSWFGNTDGLTISE